MRRKGERPVPKPFVHWSEDHPVAKCIADGDYWFRAWAFQSATPFPVLARMTGIPLTRIHAIDMGDLLSRAELDALARAWRISAGDLIASIPDQSLVTDRP